MIETQLRKDKKNKVRPNELLQRAYKLASEHEWDVLISFAGRPVFKERPR